MTPAARVQTAIEILDQVFDGAPAEKALTGWARRSRFAGSKDRAAVRDHVYDALRRRASAARMGGGLTGRAVMAGLLVQDGAELEALFTGAAYAPSRLSEAELAALAAAAPADAVEDIPEWMRPAFDRTLGADLPRVAEAMRQRAPVFLRVNLRKGTRAAAQAQLKGEGVQTEAHDLSDTALEVVEGARRVAGSAAYRNGLVELQDVSSQAAVQALPLTEGQRVLDFCAGGGGKVLAMAGRCAARYYAHDAHAQRMRDLPERARRAGVDIKVASLKDLEKGYPFDLVFCDVPCSGSGTWRRTPDAKWRFDASDLADLQRIQSDILRQAAGLVAPGGTLAYATCSLFAEENGAQIESFLSEFSGWHLTFQNQWTMQAGSDGFFLACLTRRAN
ncbi:RsmB/NOP family class I SAM-dependent RNA methyltransferase [Shimia sp. SDUM112013]|uniref:RsmB/NOP family class I SAM-dependent RNA methyltransferase n=1 Tax=Shimia sp. SDUM112013 TaxID=3136160 RepID=UPI0032EFBEB4